MELVTDWLFMAVYENLERIMLGGFTSFARWKRMKKPQFYAQTGGWIGACRAQ